MSEKATGAPLLAGVVRKVDVDSNSGQVYLGGHSYGGRQSSMLCVEEPNLVAGLLLLSYPLHPPRRPEQQRTHHLPDLRTPTLFVSGTRDPFGTINELERALKMIPAKTKLLAVEGAGHDLGFKGKGTNSELTAKILEAFQSFVK
jgi:predicted alpha/beta-hydrolase family hydrolase